KVGKDELIAMARQKSAILRLETSKEQYSDTSAEYGSIQRSIFVRRRKLNETEQLIRSHNPSLYDNLKSNGPISRQDVRNSLLKNGNSLVEIFEGDSAAYVLLLTADSSWFRKIDKSDL